MAYVDRFCIFGLPITDLDASSRVMRDESDEIWFGVGFGPEFLDRLKPNAKPSGLAPYPYRHRSGPLGDLPSTGGDIFIHAKCHERGKLFELCQAIVHSFPTGSIDKFEDIYGWVYRGGRDLSGFIDAGSQRDHYEQVIQTILLNRYLTCSEISIMHIS
ncbi:hypothetical protein CLF_102029 [Clonorchis sinensis]|uniref:Dyp-type peroxidase N-terminal domain-containing protein n=1 Tax=Clonorchis sinensis TaxID=79923 RepID=G7Y748_CLOSI|nr:hypothetical protein CLF_102029 [Clonorchis sinensis]